MGRKKRRKVQTRPKPTLPTIFECPECSEVAVRIEIAYHTVDGGNKEIGTATVTCGNCRLSREIYNVKKIEEAVDVYGNFLDQFYEEDEEAEAE